MKPRKPSPPNRHRPDKPARAMKAAKAAKAMKAAKVTKVTKAAKAMARPAAGTRGRAPSRQVPAVQSAPPRPAANVVVLRAVATPPAAQPAAIVSAPAAQPAAMEPPPAAEIIAPRGRGRQREAIATETRAFPRMKPQAAPRRGWIRAIRDALGLSQSQIAARAGVSRATVQQWERAEARRRITVHSLDRVAHAMGCTLAIAIVPKAGTLDDVRRRQALAKAIAIVKQEDAPEDPDAVTDLSAAQRRRVDRIVARLLRGSPRRLWKP